MLETPQLQKQIRLRRIRGSATNRQRRSKNRIPHVSLKVARVLLILVLTVQSLYFLHCILNGAPSQSLETWLPAQPWEVVRIASLATTFKSP